MDFPDASRFAARPRRRARRLPRRRRLVAARLPRGRLGARKHSRDFLSATFTRVRTPPPSAPARPGCTTDGVDLAGYTLPAARRRPRGRAARARLRADRPAQRERRHPHRDDLRLALPAEHPPLGDDRRQPARPLPLGPARRPTSRSQHYADLCAQDDTCSTRTRRPRRVDAARPTRDIPKRWWFLPIKPGNVRSPSSSASSTSTQAASPLTGPHDDRHAGSPPPRATRAGSGCCRSTADARLPDRPGVGRRRRHRADRRRPAQALLRGRRPTAARSSATPAPTSSGPAAGCSTPGPPTRTRTSTAACATRTSRRC